MPSIGDNAPDMRVAKTTAGLSATDSSGMVDRRQGVFVSGGTINGPVIGINQGTINYYMIEAGPSGTKLNDGPVSQIAVLDTVSIVPRPARVFYDREDAIASLQGEFHSGGGAWLTGPQGCGLTFLLRKAAGLAAASALPNGAIYLDGTAEPEDLDEILRELYNYYHAGNAPIAVTPQEARAFLGTRRALFVLDRLPLGYGELAGLADALSQGSVLIAAEGAVPETLADIQLRGLPASDALRLCASVAQIDATQPEVAALVHRLCASLGCLPLPLVLAGRLLRAQITAPAQAAALLDDLARSGEPIDREPLALAARLALRALSADEVAILAALARTHGLELDALAAVSQRALAIAEPALRRLTDLGLIVSGNERYRVASGSLRRVLDRLLPAGEERRRAAAFFAAGAIGAPAIDLAWLSREGRNLIDAIKTLLEQGQAAQAGALARAVQPALVLSGQWSTWGRVIGLAGQAAQATGDKALEAWMLHERGTRAGLLGDRLAAATDLSAARRIRLELDDKVGADVSLHNMRYLKLLPPPGPSGRSGSRRRGWITPVAASVAIVAAAAAIWLFGGPAAANAAASTSPGKPVSIDVLSGSSAFGGLGPDSIRGVGAPAHGTASVDPQSGTIIYTPSPTFIGDDHFTFQVCNSLGRCASAAVTVTIASRQPLAQDLTAMTHPGAAVDIDALGNVKVQDGTLAPETLKLVQAPSNGTTSVEPASGTLTYTPRTGFVGEDRFSYQLCDSFGACATAGVTVSVINQSPIATDATVGTKVRTPITISALDQIKDPDGALDPAAVKVVERPANGALELDPQAGTIKYTPRPDFAGEDRFSYQLCDSFGACAMANVTVKTTARPLIAHDLKASTTGIRPVVIEILKSVDDPDGTLDPASLKLVYGPASGRAQANRPPGAITYMPQRGFSGDDRLGYQVCDKTGGCVTATVTISVNALLTDPFAYCAAVGDADAPDARYAGPAVPDAIAIGLSKQLEILGRLPDKLIQWRCMGGQVFACTVGANLPCGQANTSSTPTAEMDKFCAETPNTEEIPAAVTGHDTIYTWRCAKGVPEIISQVFKVDLRGFIANFWYLIPPG
jgi:hypothetical protein